jgi:hypothetical protein
MPDMIENQSLAHDLAAWGVELPAPARTAVAVFAALTEEVLGKPPTVPLRHTIEDGTLDPAEAAERVRQAALDLAVHERAVQVARDLQYPLQKAFSRGLQTDVDAMFAALAIPFTEAAEVMHTAASLPLDLTAEQALSDETLADTWRELGRARGILDALRGLRRHLHHSYGMGPRTGTHVVWFLADVADDDALEHAQAVYRERDSGRGGAWHALAAAGYRLHLNTPAQAQALLDEVARRRTPVPAAAGFHGFLDESY